ncbi:MAG: acyl-CoA dehydrogenase family protein [Planctomycetota bacterium]|jgi:alkylation response protein AidB-like acyl-CoA dehydrogenase
MTSRDPQSPEHEPALSTAAQALAAAGDAEQARDVAALDDVASRAALRLGRSRQSLVERLIYGPLPPVEELGSGARIGAAARGRGQQVLEAALGCLGKGEAFAADRKLSSELRSAVSAAGGYGFTVPVEFGGQGASYPELAVVEEELAAHGLGALAVEISGELTIGAGSLLGYGNDAQQSLFLPMISEGRLMAFALSEVGIGVNAKKVQAYVEPDPATGGFRLFADGARNKLWITNATYGALAGFVVRIGKGGKDVGLFVVELPERDIARGDHGADHEFWMRSSDVDAFHPNHNSRIHFDNYPIPAANRIEADGVEVLFYCLRMGRCMLAAMSAGYQRMFAADATHYARQRPGVGGLVIKHELPRLALGTMLGGALQSRALSHLSLQQDADGVDLAGLRDLTKSAAATTALRSLTACERVLGGRTFDAKSRVNQARANMHVFGVVEGEDDLILMGMVKDVTTRFTDRYMAGMLGVIRSINVGPDGKSLPKDQILFRIAPGTALRHPVRVTQATVRLLTNVGFWRLVGWIVREAATEVVRLPGRLVPTSWIGRFRGLPKSLRPFARYAERKLRGRRWAYLGTNLWFQLDLTRAQIPLQRFGKGIEHLVSMLALCHHAAAQDESQQAVAALRCAQLKDEFRAIRILSGLREIDGMRAQLERIGTDLERGSSTLITDVPPEEFAHPFA